MRRFSFSIILVPRRRLELLHLAATASKTVMSTIPSPGHIYHSITWPRPLDLCVVVHSSLFRASKDILLFEWRAIRSFSSKNEEWCSRWDLNPHALGAYASETYMSTIPSPEQSVFIPIYLFLYMYPSRMSSHFVETRSRGYGSYSLREKSHIYHSITRVGLPIIEKRNRNANKTEYENFILEPLLSSGTSEIPEIIIQLYTSMGSR